MNLYPNYAQRKKYVLLLSLLFLVVPCRFSYTREESDSTTTLISAPYISADGAEMTYSLLEHKTQDGSFFNIIFTGQNNTVEKGFTLNTVFIKNACALYYEKNQNGKEYPCIGIIDTVAYKRVQDRITFAYGYTLQDLYTKSVSNSLPKVQENYDAPRKSSKNFKVLTSSTMRSLINVLMLLLALLFLSPAIYFIYKAFLVHNYDHDLSRKHWGQRLPSSVAEQLACHLHISQRFSHVLVYIIGICSVCAFLSGGLVLAFLIERKFFSLYLYWTIHL